MPPSPTTPGPPNAALPRDPTGSHLSDADWLAWARRAESPVALGRLGSYELLSEIGHGAQGTVYKARQPGTKREVVIKRLAAGSFATASMRARFEREIEALGVLRHPNIVTAHAAELVDGQPILVLEWVDGQPMDRWAAAGPEGRRDVREILATFALACDAVAHAHQHAVIHRDLKPSNIFVDAVDQPHVLDFGLATWTRDAARTTLAAPSEAHGFLGTPAYASPEQIGGGHAELDTRTDIFSLGVILYELLTGEWPFAAPDRHAPGPLLADVFDAVRRVEPRRPSSLRPELGTELDAILLKAIAKVPGERYQSADALAGDLRRFLAGEPVLAHPLTTGYELRKLVRRHRVAFGGGALLAGLVLAFAIVATVFTLRLSQRQRELLAAQQSERAQRVAAEMNAYTAALAGAEAALQAGNVNAGRLSLDQAPERLRNWEWYHYWGALDRSLSQFKLPSTAFGLAISADGRHLAAACRDGQVRVWDTNSWTTVASLPARTGEGVQVAFSPRADLLAYGVAEHGVRVWDLHSMSELASASGHAAPVTGVVFSPDGSRLATASADRTIRIWRVPPDVACTMMAPANDPSPPASLELERTLSGPEGAVTTVAFGPDGSRLASAAGDRTVILWDANTGQIVGTLRGHSSTVTAVQFSPNGEQLVSAAYDGLVKVWQVEDGRELLSVHGHDALVSAVAYSPDGTRIASAAWDKTIRVWDTHSGDPVARWLGHTDNVTAVIFSRDGRQLFTAAADETVRVWPTEDVSVLTARNSSARANGFAGPPDLSWLAVAYGSGEGAFGRIVLWDPRAGRAVATLHENTHVHARGQRLELGAIAASPDGRWLAAESGAGTILCWSTARWNDRVGGNTPALEWDAIAEAAVLRTPDAAEGVNAALYATCMSFVPDGVRLVSGHHDGALRVWSVDEATLLRSVEFGQGPIVAVLCVPPTRQILVATRDGGIVVLDAETPSVVRTLDPPTATPRALACSSDGQRLAIGLNDAGIELWDTAGWTRAATLRSHSAAVRCLAFSPDGSRLVSGSDDRTLKLWDVPTGREVATFHGHGYLISGVTFTADGARIISSSGDGTVRLWDSTEVHGSKWSQP